MIDLADVSAALVNALAAAAYPNGTGAASITGGAIRVFPGWPMPQQLNADMSAGVSYVSVYPQSIERNTSPLGGDWAVVALNAATLSASVAGKAVTLAGTVSTPQNVAIAVNGKPYSYGVQAGDSLASIASSLAALISVDVPASASGAVVNVPSAISLKASIGVAGIAAREAKRQAKQFQIGIWSGKPTDRDTITAVCGLAIAKAPRLALPYGYAAHLTYKGSKQDDSEQLAGIYRCDLFAEADYPTVETETEFSIVGVQENFSLTVGGTSVPLRTVWSA